jgi:16S rRNA (cytosine1402-N4)-methyltransferase
MTEYHRPVLLDACVEGLHIREEGIYADLTFGSGGHSSEILKHLKGGKLVAFDQDKDAENNRLENEHFVFVHGNFRFFKNYLQYLGISEVDGILADLGVSSHHFDSSERGFSYRFSGPLDMRMNRNAGLTAADLVHTASEDELRYIFRTYGELEQARRITSLIVSARTQQKIETTEQLCNVLLPVTPRHQEYRFLSKVFQALRIRVNAELEALEEMLLQVPDTLKTGGRLVILTYHSLEDRMVKNFMKSGNFEGKIDKDLYGHPVNTPFRVITRKAGTASEQEIIANPRARSAKLRIAEKI